MVETTDNVYVKLDHGIEFRLHIAEIRQSETMSQTLRKYISAFDYFDNILLVLSATKVVVFLLLYLLLLLVCQLV